MTPGRLVAARVLAVLVACSGLAYIGWRWTDTLNWNAWWIAIPLVLAETYSLGESLLFSFMSWRASRRPAPPAAPAGRTVDLFITTYNEPLEMVLATAIAARDVNYPHSTWILDDGDRPEFREAAARIGVGYLDRGPDWDGHDRHAKAGNINNALFQTSGELVAILDADQIPDPAFLERIIGYFDDPNVAFVQTPQHFWNVPDSDPLGCRADLFYGPIQQGKDGWGAAFFCGSNAVLRREALMSLGVQRYSDAATALIRSRLREARRIINREADIAPRAVRQAWRDASEAVTIADRLVRRGEVLSHIGFDLRARFDEIIDTYHLWSSDAEILRAIALSVDVSRIDQALAINPIDISTVTEDMATAMHLHSMGWQSVYHHEVLVEGVAPEDVRTALGQRKRWAAGTMQVFFDNNPLFKRGLSLPQRLMYLATMTSYLSGFAALVYIVAPLVFLTTGIFPVDADPHEFAARFLPFFVATQLINLVTGFRCRGLWRGQQYSFALFPVWISATLSAAAATFFGRKLTFSVTAKDRTADTRADYAAVRIQLVVIAALAAASIYGLHRVAGGHAPAVPTYVSLIWVMIDIALLAVVIRAARYRGYTGPSKQPVLTSAPEEPCTIPLYSLDPSTLDLTMPPADSSRHTRQEPGTLNPSSISMPDSDSTAPIDSYPASPAPSTTPPA